MKKVAVIEIKSWPKKENLHQNWILLSQEAQVEWHHYSKTKGRLAKITEQNLDSDDRYHVEEKLVI